MKPDYLSLLVEHNLSSIFLDHTGCVKAMDICYEMGKKDGADEFISWLNKMDHLSDNLKYITEEWKNQKNS